MYLYIISLGCSSYIAYRENIDCDDRYKRHCLILILGVIISEMKTMMHT
jgi:hypothetical protein